MDPHSAASMRFRHVLITGPPGIGKTTLCRKVMSLIGGNGLTCDGFFTEEIRSANAGTKRIGFDVVPVKNPERRLPLARAINDNEQAAKGKFRVGNYAVFPTKFEQVALPVFETDSDVLLVDEIGKMELLSKSFEEKVDELIFGIDGRSRCMLATIPEVAPARLRLIQKLRSDPRCKIIQVSHKNRDDLPGEICKIMSHIVDENKLKVYPLISHSKYQ